MDISVVIPSYKSFLIIEKVLKAVCSQKTDLEYEIILIDSSPDDQIDKVVEKFKAVKFTKLSIKTSASKARNLGFEKSTGKLILFLDSDVSLDPYALELAWKKFNNSSKIFSGSLILDASSGFSFSSFLEFSFFFNESFYGNPNLSRRNLPATMLFVDREVFLNSKQFTECGRIEDTKLTEELRHLGNDLFFHKEIKGAFYQEVSFPRFLLKCFYVGNNIVFIRFGIGLSKIKRFCLCLISPFVSCVKFLVIVYRNLTYRQGILDRLIFIFTLPAIFLGALAWNIGIVQSLLFKNDFSVKR